MVGYSEIVCVSCTNGAQTITLDDISYTQSASKCLTSLANADVPVTEKTLEYMETAQTVAVVTDFFKNTGEESCAATSCTLKAVGCTEPYSSTMLTAEGTSITNKNVDKTIALAGYTENVCVSCTNDQQTITIDNFKYT